jgi:hypothetical protein
MGARDGRGRAGWDGLEWAEEDQRGQISGRLGISMGMVPGLDALLEKPSSRGAGLVDMEQK